MSVGSNDEGAVLAAMGLALLLIIIVVTVFMTMTNNRDAVKDTAWKFDPDYDRR